LSKLHNYIKYGVMQDESITAENDIDGGALFKIILPIKNTVE
jgi:hypothetical protein